MGVTRTHDIIEEIRDRLGELQQIADEVVLRARSGVPVPTAAAPANEETQAPTSDEELNAVQPDAAPSSPMPMPEATDEPQSAQSDVLLDEPQTAEGRDTPTRNFPTIKESAPVQTTAETPSNSPAEGV